MMLYNYVRSKKKDGTLPVSNNSIREMLEEIIREGLLVRQEDESYRLADDYKKKKQAFLQKKGASPGEEKKPR
jgi:Mn-dependent DtxR family transcriptional regulator